MKRSIRDALSLTIALLACGMPHGSQAHGDEPPDGFNLQNALAEARKATSSFNDVAVAVAANYVKFPDQAGDRVAQSGQGAWACTT